MDDFSMKRALEWLRDEVKNENMSAKVILELIEKDGVANSIKEIVDTVAKIKKENEVITADLFAVHGFLKNLMESICK